MGGHSANKKHHFATKSVLLFLLRLKNPLCFSSIKQWPLKEEPLLHCKQDKKQIYSDLVEVRRHYMFLKRHGRQRDATINARTDRK